MKIKVYNQKGQEAEEKVTLNKVIWGVDLNNDLVAQVLYVFNSNKRAATAHAKRRSDVSGGGRKPHRQKGTGRARAGSIRSPLWVKGGVTFVPNNRNWQRNINEKMKKKAVASVLSHKLSEDALKFIKFPSKKDSKALRQDLVSFGDGLKTLVVSKDENILKSIRNVKDFKISKPENFNIHDVLDNKRIFFDIDAIKIVEERLNYEK